MFFSLTGVHWPFIPADTSVREAVRGLTTAFHETQWLAPEVLRDRQLEQIRQVLLHFRKSSEWCAHRWRHLPELEQAPMTMELLRQVPVLRRVDIQDAGEAIFALHPGDHGTVFHVSSSGSTGQPVAARKTSLNIAFHEALTLRSHLWHRHDFGQTLAHVQGYPVGMAMPPDGERGEAWAPTVSTGPGWVFNSAHSTLGQQLDFLARIRPAYILSYPTNLHALAVRMAETGVSLPSVRSLITFSEMLTPGCREVVEAGFGVGVEDIVSCAELSTIALQCPDDPTRYHVQSENVLVEILDDDDQPVPVGDRGRVVVTDLHNFVMPLVRYEVGDLASFGNACTCGRGLPVLDRFYGRVRNMLLRPDGEEIFPDIAALRLHEVAPLRQYQMVQDRLDGIEMKVVLARPLEPAEEASLRELVLGALGFPIDLRLVEVERVERHPSGKFEDFICSIARDG